MIIGVPAVKQPPVSGIHRVAVGEGAHLQYCFPGLCPVSLLPRVLPPPVYSVVFGVLFPAVPAGVSWDEFFLDELVELVQVDVAEHGRYHAALRNPAQRVMVLPVFQVPGLEHVTDQPEKPVITDLLRQYPEKNIVAETAEAVGDVSLDKPHGPGPGLLDLPQRGMTAPPFPETMRPARKLRLVIRLQQEPHYFAGELV